MNSFWKKFLIRTGVLAGVIGASVGLTYGLTAHKHKQQLQTEYNKGYENAQTNEAFYKEQLEIYKNLVAEQNKTITNFTNRINNLNNTVEQQKVQITTLNSQLETANARIQALESENTDYLTQITQLQARKTELEARVAELEQSGSDNSAEIAQLQEEITSLNGQITTLQNIIANNYSTIASLQTQVANYEQQVTSLQTDIIANETLIQEYEAKIAQLEESVAYLEAYFDVDVGENKSVVKFMFNGNVYNAQVVDNGSTVTVTEPESTEYIIFNGWTLNDETVNPSTVEITKNTTFIADITYKYKVQFVVEGQVVNSQIVEQNTNATIIEEPTKDEFMFAGWTIDGETVIDISNYPITENTIFIAKFVEPVGLFDDITGQLIYTWQELINEGYINVSSDGILTSNQKASSLTGKLIIDSSVTSFEGYADDRWPQGGVGAFSNITELVIPNSVVRFGNSNFTKCSKLTKVNYLGTLEDWLNITISPSSFNSHLPTVNTHSLYLNDVKLEGHIIIPDNITAIKTYALAGIEDITSIDFNNVTTIYSLAFSGCSGLTNVIFHETLSTIAYYAFRYCSKLESVYIPSSVTTIETYGSGSGQSPFFGCSSLVIYCGVSTAPDSYKYHWNYSSSSNVLTTKYGYTYEQYLAEINEK